MAQKKYKTYYWTMITAMFLRLVWAVFFETRGMKKVIANHPDTFVANTIGYVVFGQIIILLPLIILSLIKKYKWVYKINFILGIILSCMIIYMPIMGLNPGRGPLFVIPISLAVAIFSYLTMKNTDKIKNI